MHKSLFALTAAALSLGLATGARAEFGDVTTSTDPARAAAIEQHAQELKAREMRAPDRASMHAMHSMHSKRSMHAMHTLHAKHSMKHRAHHAMLARPAAKTAPAKS